MAPSSSPDRPPLRVRSVLGRQTEGVWPGRLSRSRVEVLRLSQSDAHRTKLRRRTDSGTEVAVTLERGTVLRDGDVLCWDERSRTALVARVDLGEVMVVDLSASLGEGPEVILRRGVQVGHALGNQHWPAVVSGSRVYVPLMVARDVMAAVVDTHAFEGISCTFASGDEVAPTLAPQDARLLFAGAGGHRHEVASRPAGEEE
jgi:urease accessory protein